MSTPESQCGPAAFLALFAPPGCQSLDHVPCAEHMCPCVDARTWLRALPADLPFEQIWARITRADWLIWLLSRYGLPTHDGDRTCAALRAKYPWSTVAAALANPPATIKCERCREVILTEEDYDGLCESCDNQYVYCGVCEDRVHEDGLCDHLRWSDAAGGHVGTGEQDDEGHRRAFDRLLGRIGRRFTRKLRDQLADGSWWTWHRSDDVDGAVNEAEERARDTDDRDHVEVGLAWLDTLGAEENLRSHVKKTLEWIDAHLAARDAAIAADKRPRRLLRDGAGRYYVLDTGTWTAVREEASWMHLRRARRFRRRLRGAYPNGVIRMVHVLTPHRGKAES